MIVLKDVLGDEEIYNKTFSKYYGIVVKNFDDRFKYVNVAFPDGTVEKMRLNKFLVNFILWKPFMVFKRDVTKDFLLETSNINADILRSYFDSIIVEFIEDDSEVIDNIKEILSFYIKELGNFALDFNKKIGNTISLYDIWQLCKKVPRFKELLYTRYDNINTREIEKDLAEKTNELMDILGSYENCFQDYVNCKEGLNKNQLTQFFINVGPKPDLRGHVFPRIVNSNFVTDGLQSATDYFINNSGGRKSAIINYINVKSSGYLNRKLSLLCMNVDIDMKTKDCKSPNYISVNIDSALTLSRFNNRYFYDEEKKKVRLFRYDEKKADKYVGTTMKFRSPITCACKGDYVCKTCYGKLSFINQDIHIGILAVEILTSQLTQLMLSAKHLLKTSTKKIDLGEKFSELFILDGNSLVLDDNIENIDQYYLVINETDIIENEDSYEDIDDEDEYDNVIEKSLSKYLVNLTLKRYSSAKKKSIDEIYPLTFNMELYLSPYLLDMLNKKAVLSDDGIYTLNLKHLKESTPIFYIELENNELSSVLNDIMKLIDKKEHLGMTTYDEMINKFIDLTNQSTIKINSLNMELIIRELIKSVDDVLQRPDFSKLNPEYIIFRLSDAILNEDSFITSLSFEKFKDQIYNVRTYRKKNKSLLDYLFK